jgi:signal transduction histidine kinase
MVRRSGCSAGVSRMSRVFELHTLPPPSEGGVESASDVLHDVGNLVNHVGVGIGVLRRQWASPAAIQTLRSFVNRVEGNPDLLRQTVDAGPDRLTTWMKGVIARLETDNASVDAQLGQLAGTLEDVRDIIRRQQGTERNSAYARLVDVGAIVSDIVDLARDDNASLGIRFDVEGPRSVAMVVDRARLYRVLTNLVRNAVDAVSGVAVDRRQVTVSVETTEDGVRFSVTDSGVGIDPADAVRIFRRGFTTKPDGHGFGLMACERAANEMGGSLAFRSPGRDRGATFTFSLPWRPPEVA